MIKCLICGKQFRKPLAHAWQKHGMSAREYKEHFSLDVKKGIIPPEDREKLANNTRENGTIKNLQQGAKFRFAKGHTINYKRSEQTLARLKNHFEMVSNRKGRTIKVEKIKINCAICGKEKMIYPRYYQINNNYCGINCRNKANNNDKRTNNKIKRLDE